MDAQHKHLKYRPAVYVLAGIITGISGADILHCDSTLSVSLGVTIAVLAALISFFTRRITVLRLSLLALATIALGFCVEAVHNNVYSTSMTRKLARLHSRSAIIYGQVISQRDSAAFSDRYVIHTDSLAIDSSVIRTSENIFIMVSRRNEEPSDLLLLRRQYVKIYAELESLDAERNPFALSAGSALQKKMGVVASAWVKSVYDIYTLDATTHDRIGDHIADFFEGINNRIQLIFTRAVRDSSARALVSAVVLGDKKGIDDETATSFRRAGLAHILVVSGFNVAIVAAMIYYVLRFVGLYRLRLRIVLSMIAVALYALIVGLEPSVVRALLTVELVFLGQLIERKPDIGNITAFVASVALLLDPSLLFDAGFQLTYGAVFALVLISPRFASLLFPNGLDEVGSTLGKIIFYVGSTLIASVSVTIGLLPVMLYHFHRITLVGVLANAAGIPVAAILTVLSFFLIPLTALSQFLGSVYGDVTIVLANLLSWLANFSSSFKWSSMVLPQPNTLFSICYFLSIAVALSAQTRRQFIARSAIVSVVVGILLLLNVPFVSPVVAKNDLLSVLFFDVGQGDAAVVHTPNNKTYLIDFGGISFDGRTTAERQIIPLIEAESMTVIDGGFISHMHVDHYGGAQALLKEGYVRHLFTSGERTSAGSALTLDSMIHADHTPVTKLQRGDTIHIDNDIIVYVLNPDTATAVGAGEMNHHSLVLKLCYGRTSMLFLGDIEASDELLLKERFGSFLRSDIVKVAHHGSRYSSSSDFAQAVRAQYAVVSVGEHNFFGHPTATALSHWYQAGSQVHRTDREGAILFRSDGQKVWREDWK